MKRFLFCLFVLSCNACPLRDEELFAKGYDLIKEKCEQDNCQTCVCAVSDAILDILISDKEISMCGELDKYTFCIGTYLNHLIEQEVLSEKKFEQCDFEMMSDCMFNWNLWYQIHCAHPSLVPPTYAPMPTGAPALPPTYVSPAQPPVYGAPAQPPVYEPPTYGLPPAPDPPPPPTSKGEMVTVSSVMIAIFCMLVVILI